jgi:hypothetical protein
MKARAYKDEDQLITKAVDVLVKELGPVEASRFLALPKKKRFESVKRHRRWQAQLQRDEFFDRVFATKGRGPVRK